MTELGSGLALDEQFDLYVDQSSGDLASASGAEEVTKDLAFRVARFLQNFEGSPLTAGEREDMKIGLKKLFTSDPRIESVQQLDIDGPDAATDTIEIDTRLAVVDGTTIDTIFTV